MNIAKNMEAVFLAAIVAVSITSAATAATPRKLIDPPRAQAAATAAASANMIVITDSHKRLTAAEKAALI
jgi:hypothetical protein